MHSQTHQPQQLDATAGGRTATVLAQKLSTSESGIRFIYDCLERIASEAQLQDAILVMQEPAIGRQIFRAHRKMLQDGWATKVALEGEPGLHTNPPLSQDADVSAAINLCTVALRLDVLKHRSLRDPLTGLYNRRGFEEHLSQAVDRSYRYGWQFTLVLLDLDGLKKLNDTAGHAVGDMALRATGEELLRLLRRGDMAARVGGDEFALILPKTDPEAVPGLMERLRVRLSQALPQENLEGNLGFSAGAAGCPAEADDFEGLYVLADERLYAAKSR